MSVKATAACGFANPSKIKTKEGFSIVKGFVNFCWFIFKWGIVPGALAAAIVLPHVFHRINEEIRRHVEKRFDDHYAHLNVSIRSAELVEGVGIEIRGMSFRRREPVAAQQSFMHVGDPSPPLVFFERVVLECPTDLAKLIRTDVPVSKITIYRPTVRLTRHIDGSWSTADLLPLPCFGNSPPEVIVEGGVVEIVDERKNPTSMYTLRDVALRLDRPSQDSAADNSCAGERQVSGSLTGDHMRRAEFTGKLDPTTASWDIGGVIEGLELSPELSVSLPSLATERLRKTLGAFRGRGRFEFRICNGDSPQVPVVFQLSGDVDEGRLDDRRLPYPLMNITASIRCSNDGFSVQNMFAQSGQTTLRLSGRMAGFDENSPWQLEAEINNLVLERSLRSCLPKSMQQIWDKYDPSGELNQLQMKLQADVNGFRSDLAEIDVDCGDVSFSYVKFPYKLEHAHGNIDLRKQTLTAELTGYSSRQPIAVKAEIVDPLATLKTKLPAAGWCTISAASIPLDDKLFAAIGKYNTRSRSTLDRLAPRGTVGYYGKIWREKPGDEPNKHFIISLNGCSIKFEGFPYPVRDIHGTIERFADGGWLLRDFEGFNDIVRVTGRGSLTDTKRGKLLSLVLNAADVPLDKQLQDALQLRMQRVWEDTKPQGIVHLEEIKIDWYTDKKHLDLSFVALPRGDTVSIEPKLFPYRLNKVEGRMVYRNGHVDLKGFKAHHGQVDLSADGYCEFPREGGWHFHLDRVNVDRLKLDRELVRALPERLRKGVLELNPTGPMYLRDGSFDLAQGGLPDDPLRSAWRMTLGFHQCNVDCGVKLHDMHGTLTIGGQYNGLHYQSQGMLDIDSLMYKNIQFTNVKGPIEIDNDNVWLGYSGIDSGPVSGNPRSNMITAQVFGGELQGNCLVALDGTRKYSLDARIRDADLARCAKETMPGQHQLQGKVAAAVSLRGSGRSLNTLEGRGEIRLTEANVYELPLMISLLKILSNSPPDTNAFSESYMKFRIGGNHIYFYPINFTGDAISLRGRGEMDFQSNVKLQFYTVVGRDKWHVPVISPVLGGASQQALVINVTGPLRNPQTTREIFPLAQKALQQLQEDLRSTNILGNPTAGSTTPTLPPTRRPWASPSGQPLQGRQSIQPSTIK